MVGGDPLRSQAVMPEDLGGRRNIVIAHANDGWFVARFGAKEFHGDATHGIGIYLVDLVRHFCNWDLAPMHEYLELC